MIGKIISHYKILEKIGGGGMGVVYKAQDLKLDRLVALKFLPPHLGTDETEKQRFMQEAKAASALDHPNLCTIYEIDTTEDGQLFISMAYYEGETVHDMIAAGPLPVKTAISIAVQVTRGLVKAHEKGIVHRDIKPANMMVTRDGVVKIVDFGLAKLAGSTSITMPGITMGTVSYMSPEQVHGENVTHQTDIWALGVVLYEMITGQLPFKKENDHATIYAILNEEPEPLARLQPNAPVELTQVVNKAMAKNPAERYQRVDEMLSDLSSLQKARTSLTVKEPVTKANLPPSIAVLPFVNMCPDKENEYFSDGMTEEIINALTKIEGLRVASRTSVFAFKGKEENIRKIGDQLNVRLLLEGSVRKAGNRLRITAQLINVADGYHLWSETYDRNVQDVFAIQDEISRTIVRTLKIKLNSDPNTPLVKRHTDDLDAYQLYLKGRHYWSQRTKETLKKAVEHLARAIEKDPAYALAYSGLADCYNILGKYSYLPPKEAYPKAAAAAMKALAIDDTLAEAYASLGCVKSVYDWDWPNAKRAFQHAIELNPGYVTAHQWYAINYLTPLERMDEAIEEMLRARKLDPLSLIVNTTLGLVLYFAHQYDQAIEQYRKTLELDPNFGIAHFFLAWAYAEKARYEEAIAALQKAQSFTDDSTVLLAESGYVHAVSGNKNHKNQAMKIVGDLERINQKGTISPYAMYSIAATYASLGNRDRAFDWLHRAYKERSFRLIYLKVDPRLDNLRSDSRFAGLLKLVGLESR